MSGRYPGPTRRFSQMIRDDIYMELERVAKQRDITVEALIRAVVIPEWMADQNEQTTKRTGNPAVPDTSGSHA